MLITPEPISDARAAGGVPTLAPSWVSWGIRATATTAPTAPTLAIALAPSNGIRLLKNVFLKPVTGLSFPQLGLIGWNVGLKPTRATLAATPANRHMPAIGATVVNIVVM